MANIKMLQAYGIAVVGLAVVTLTGIAILTQFKSSGLVDNDTADNFIAGLAIFGTFMAVVVIALIGKLLVSLWKDGKDGGM